MPSDRFEAALQEIAHRFAKDIVHLIRTTTVEELVSLAQPEKGAVALPEAQPEVAQPRVALPEAQPEVAQDEAPEKPAKRRGRPPKAKTDAEPVEAPAKRRGRPPKVKTEAQATAAPISASEATDTTPPAPAEAQATNATQAPEAKPKRKKRAWPKCSIEGCEKGFYAPSGTPRLCYRHHLAEGGAPSPLVLAAQKKQVKAKAPKTPKAEKPRTIRRKKGDKAK